eukprot:5497478-Prymnesium_polylepis.1
MAVRLEFGCEHRRLDSLAKRVRRHVAGHAAQRCQPLHSCELGARIAQACQPDMQPCRAAHSWEY